MEESNHEIVTTGRPACRDQCNWVPSQSHQSIVISGNITAFHSLLQTSGRNLKIKWYHLNLSWNGLPSQVQVNAREGSDISAERRIQESLQLGRGRREWAGAGAGESTEENWTTRTEPAISPTIETVCQVQAIYYVPTTWLQTCLNLHNRVHGAVQPIALLVFL